MDVLPLLLMPGTFWGCTPGFYAGQEFLHYCTVKNGASMYVVPRSKRGHVDAVVFQPMRYRFAAAVVVAPQVLDGYPGACHHGECLRSIGHGVLSRAFQTQRHRFSVVGQTLGRSSSSSPISRCDSKSGSVSQYSTNSSMPLLRKPLRPASVALFCGSALLIALRPKIAAFQNQRIQQVFFQKRPTPGQCVHPWNSP